MGGGIVVGGWGDRGGWGNGFHLLEDLHGKEGTTTLATQLLHQKHLCVASHIKYHGV